ncbi:MAG: serine kinase [Candidatus Cloacimonadota bacterium]|nr:MAG: serine kinase [Candidatus Cloacimonadota bacterium]PIE79107.1 MAG: serine kinase [Candidatus Delongbacteria bacterium]
MKVKDLVEKLNLIVYSGDAGLDREVTGGYVSDLLSDVMGSSREGDCWITLQTHKNVAAIADLRDLGAILLVKSFKPDEDMLESAIENEIPVLGTDKRTFEISGEIYNILKECK